MVKPRKDFVKTEVHSSDIRSTNNIALQYDMVLRSLFGHKPCTNYNLELPRKPSAYGPKNPQAIVTYSINHHQIKWTWSSAFGLCCQLYKRRRLRWSRIIKLVVDAWENRHKPISTFRNVLNRSNTIPGADPCRRLWARAIQKLWPSFTATFN